MNLETNIVRILEYIPFLIGATGGGSKMNVPRVAEALLIAGITAAATGFVTIKVVEQKAVSIEARVDKIEIKIDKLVNDLYEPKRYGRSR